MFESLHAQESSIGVSPSRVQLGRRWHFQHGPIDLIIAVDGNPGDCTEALDDCWQAFQSILPALVSELALLKRPASERPGVCGAVARRMRRACDAFADSRFITLMGSVAGAVADELIPHFQRPGIVRACINNGGDIALHLAPDSHYTVGIVANPQRPDVLDGVFAVKHCTAVRGIATSGWRGRSFSLGIADSVTVLASDAASADAAATLIANAVDCAHPGIERAPANDLKDDTDLGNLAVTVQVPVLPHTMKVNALACGRREAELWRDRGVIHAAALCLQGCVEIVPLRATASAGRRESCGSIGA